MSKATLSENETRTLLGLVKFPTLNDRQLSERIDIKMSTVTAIKNRLKDMGYFITVRVPNLQFLGAEVLSVSSVHTDPSVPEETQVEVGRKLVEEFDELFYIGSGPRYRFSISIHRNYSGASAMADQVIDLYSRSGMLIPGQQRTCHFPFDRTKVYNFFDHSALLERAFDIQLPVRDEDHQVHDGKFGQIKTVKLSRIERKVLRGLVSNPDLLDSNISKRIDVTRQSVTKMRKRFEGLDLFRALRIPNLEMLGFQVMALVHTRYHPTSTVKGRASSLKAVYSEMPIIFQAENDAEGIELVATHDFKEFDDYMNLKVSHLRSEGAIVRDPVAYPFTFSNFQAVKNHVYSPVLAKITEQD